MKKTIATKTAERLNLTAEGKVLLKLVEEHGAPAVLATRLKVDPQAVRHWIYVGSIPKSAAIAAAKILKVKPQDLRPDLPAEAWKIKAVEEKPVREPIARTSDAKLLVALADKFGGVKELCERASCSTAEFHTWKTRGRIPAIKLPTFVALQQ